MLFTYKIENTTITIRTLCVKPNKIEVYWNIDIVLEKPWSLAVMSLVTNCFLTSLEFIIFDVDCISFYFISPCVHRQTCCGCIGLCFSLLLIYLF